MKMYLPALSATAQDLAFQSLQVIFNRLNPIFLRDASISFSVFVAIPCPMIGYLCDSEIAGSHDGSRNSKG